MHGRSNAFALLCIYGYLVGSVFVHGVGSTLVNGGQSSYSPPPTQYPPTQAAAFGDLIPPPLVPF